MRRRIVTDVVRWLPAGALSLLLIGSSPSAGEASIPSSGRLYRADVTPRQAYTRISVKFDSPPRYSIETLPGNRLRLVFQDVSGPLLHKFRRYSDSNIGGLVFSRRGNDLMVTFQIGRDAGWRDASVGGVNAVTLEVGSRFNRPRVAQQTVAGREKIWSGVEKLVRDFDPPLKTEIPFQPTDRKILKEMLDEAGVSAFMDAEAALYKGQLSTAEESFLPFVKMQGPVKALALYRLGEVRYKLQKYRAALASFREAEALWPAYLTFSPATTFYFGDCIARNGDLAGARTLLGGLISRLSDKKFAPALLVRLADVELRQGRSSEARAIYLTVRDQFKDKAHIMARMRLADADFFDTTPWSYKDLAANYLTISQESSDVELREEALFKQALLVAMYGGTAEALQNMSTFQRRFPRGVYAAVSRTIREVLVSQMFAETAWESDPLSLVHFVEEQQNFLAGCVVQPGFLARVVKAYDQAGQPIELVRLFDSLLNHAWSPADAGYLYGQIAENSEVIGDSDMAVKTLHTFLRKFPGHPRSREFMERLGALEFHAGKYKDAKGELSWLMKKGERAVNPSSYYYLGKSLWMLKEYPAAAKAIDQFLVTAPRPKTPEEQLLPDAHLVAATARDFSGDRKGAVKVLTAGIALPANPRKDEFLYKAGEISLRDGKKQDARTYFEQLAKNGTDPEWKGMAQQALSGLPPAPPGK